MTAARMLKAAVPEAEPFTLAEAVAAVAAARTVRAEAATAVQAACDAFPGMTDRRIIESLQPLSGNEHLQLAGTGVTTEQREGIRRRIAFHDALAAETKAINALSTAEKVRDDMQAAADAAALGDGRKALADAIAAHAEAVKAGGTVRAKVEKARGALVKAQAEHRAAETALAEARERAIGALTVEDGAQPPELKALRRALADATDDVDIATVALARAEEATAAPDYAESKAREAVEAAADTVLSLGFDATIKVAREAAGRMARLAWLAEVLGSKTPGYGGEGYRRQQEARVLNPGMCVPINQRQAIYDGVIAEVAAARAALLSDPSAPLPTP